MAAHEPLPQPVGSVEEASLECSELLRCVGEDGLGSGVGGGGGRGGGTTSDGSRPTASSRNLRRWCLRSLVVLAPTIVLAAFVMHSRRGRAEEDAAGGRHAGDLRLAPVVQADAMTAGQGGGEGEGGEEGRGASLPQCFSSLDADPSRGEWTECEGGVRESPVDMVDWVWDNAEYRFYQMCSNLWLKDHADEGPMPHWKWRPDDCSLAEVDADKFCRVMEGRKGILFVGDSLTRIMASTLASVLRAEVRAPGDDEEKVNGEARQADRWTACGGELNFSFIRNDFLDPRTVEYDGIHCEEPDVSKTRCVAFALSSVLKEVDTLVLNSGAHKRNGGWEAYGDAMRVSSASLTASMKSLHGDNAILVVRNTVPGHWGCEERMFEGPVSAEVATSLVAAGPETFEWGDFDANNRVLEEAFTSTGGGWRVLDAYTPTLLRADLHHGSGDCLHYCVPGPIDHWVRLLYNILLVETAEKS